MKNKTMQTRTATVRWRQFSRKGYASFQSLGRVISISALTVSTLTHATPATAQARMALRAAVQGAQQGEPVSDDAEWSVLEEENVQAGLQVPGGTPQQVVTAERSVVLEDVVVTGTRVPLSVQHSPRIVQVLSRQEIEASAAQSVNDLLKSIAGVDVRQRGAFGVQTDIGVNGGNTDQLTVLLNGVNISNAHTGHLTMDLPVSVDDIERIEVLEGGASRVYGSSAFSGTINIVTRQAQQSAVQLRAEGGSFGTFGGGAALDVRSRQVMNRVSAGYGRSDGGTDNSDFNKAHVFVNGGYSHPQVDIRWQAGASTLNYGANTFYSAAYRNQYEENRRYMVAVSAETKGKVHFMPQVYWNRSLDRYLLNRDNPAAYENCHQLNVYGANLTAYTTWALGKTAFGAEIRNEGILSNNLGKPLEESEYVKVPGRDKQYTKSDNRTNISYFLEHDVVWDKVTLSVGVLANLNTALDHRMRLYPGVDVSWRMAKGWKLYASFNQALRLPTFTDLYYQSPTINGNVGLRPEKSTDVILGVQYDSPVFQTKLRGMYRRGTDMIDWVKYDAEDTFHATNFNLDYYGLEWNAAVDFTQVWGARSFLKRFTTSYATIYQDRKLENEVYLSKYAMDYLRHKWVASLNHRLVSRLEMQWDVRVQHRNGEFELYEAGKNTGTLQPYGTTAQLDVKVQWRAPRYTLYVQANNLTNHRYYDYGNILQPGLWIMAGVKLHLGI